MTKSPRIGGEIALVAAGIGVVSAFIAGIIVVAIDLFWHRHRDRR